MRGRNRSCSRTCRAHGTDTPTGRTLQQSQLKAERKREAARAWNAANPERAREQNRKRYERVRDTDEHKASNREAARAWNAANPERAREQNRKRYERVRDTDEHKASNREALPGASKGCKRVISYGVWMA